MRWSIRIFAVSAVLQTMAWSQSPPAVPRQRPLALQPLPEPPVPADPLELVSGDAQTVQTPEQRQAATALLSKARALSNVRAQPYDLKTAFTTFGSSSSDGSWTLEDMSPARDVYRWTAQGPGYSGVNLYDHQLLYSNQPSSAIPLRLTQVREALFFVYPGIGPYMSLRTADANLNGLPLHCVLTAHGFAGKAFSGGRNWEKSEYCMDANSGLLVICSSAPGMYVHFDYTSAIRFHGKIIPGTFTISEAGRPIIEARTESVTDPTGLSPTLFQPTGLTSIGLGSIMTAAARVRSLIRPSSIAPGGNTAVNLVAVHAVAAPDGSLSETEILASSDPSLNQTGLDRAAHWQVLRQAQSGATPQSHEVIFLFEFRSSS